MKRQEYYCAEELGGERFKSFHNNSDHATGTKHQALSVPFTRLHHFTRHNYPTLPSICARAGGGRGGGEGGGWSGGG
jgi:hypothetical protein